MKCKIQWVFISFATLIFYNVAAQNTWTLIKNDSFPNYGVQGVQSVGNHIPGRVYSISCNDKNGDLWLYGGSYEGGGTFPYFNLRDLWKFSTTTRQWTWMYGPFLNDTASPVYSKKFVETDSANPGLRIMGTLMADTAGYVWLYGGNNSYWLKSIEDRFGDLWRFNPTTLKWSWYSGDSIPYTKPIFGTKGVASLNNKPGARINMVGEADKSGNLWLYGDVNRNDLWKYNTNSKTWTWVSGDTILNATGMHGATGVFSTTNKPGTNASFIKLDVSGSFLWLYRYPEIWKYKISTNQWAFMGQIDTTTYLTATYGTMGVEGSTVHPKTNFTSTVLLDTAGNYLVYGGYGWTSDSNGNDSLMIDVNLWRFNIKTKKWTWVYGDSTGQGGTNFPPVRGSAKGWVDKNNKVWLFGGVVMSAPGCPSCFDYFMGDVWQYSPMLPLPVNLISFTGQLQKNSVVLKWNVKNEQNFSSYEIERSSNSIVFEKVGSVLAQSISEYNYEDLYNYVSTQKNKKLFYRLKLIDKDGHFMYSEVIKVHIFSNEYTFEINPNPAHEWVTVSTPLDKGIIIVSDFTGKQISAIRVTSHITKLSLINMPKGICILTFYSDNLKFEKKLVIQ